jgi:ATP-dependent DNA helicase DinG
MKYKKEIERILGPQGVVAKSMPNYEHRKQQTEMALAVFEALTSDDHLIIEAPTGTGKTLAYLVAAALSRKRIAISTGTKNLQEQLFYKDIPFLREKIFPTLKAALLKGRGNFVCHSRLRRFLRQPHLQAFDRADSLEEILEWYRKKENTSQGDRAELERLTDDDPVWPDICSTTETCLGKKCQDRERCFVLKMRARAADADLMVINHHLLASDLVVRESGFGEVIPHYESLIIDEAHGFEDAVTQHFGFHVSHFRIMRVVSDARIELATAKISDDKFEKALTAIEYDARRLFINFQDVAGAKSQVGHISPELVENRDALCADLKILDSMLLNLPNAPEEMRGIARRSTEICIGLEIILAQESGGDYACWAERRERNVVLHASPVEIGDTLKSNLYEKIPGIIFTSATLSSGGSLDYFKSRLGLDGDSNGTENILDSPFDYARQTMLFIPQSIPEPNAPGFTEAVSEVIQGILYRTLGRAFVLFTSYKNMDTVYKLLEGRVPFPLLVQGQRPKSRLLQEFREKPGSVLFATASFWEGVDVQGEALSCVIVDRLPFAPPDDPLVSARMERIKKNGGEPFYSFQVPMAVLALKQGLGRLIRTRSDRGILCILDIRILTKSYGRIFRKSLYESPLCRKPEEIEAFFSGDSDCE